VIIEWALK